jgi:2-oxoglutarate ferredoxin oxidoreductase subunit alpha
MDALPPSAPVLTVEMNMGQMVHDVKFAAAGSRDVEFYGTAGGIVPSPDNVANRVRQLVTSRVRETVRA